MSKYKKGVQQSVDKIEKGICRELKKRGWTIENDHDDVLCGYRGKTLWIELKNESPFKKDGKIKKNVIRDSQFKILWNWYGQYNICWSVEQIINIGVYAESIELIGITPDMFRRNFKKWLTDEMLKYLREEKIINY